MTNPYYSSEENTHFYPIIFVRGFAMRDADIEQAVNEPFSGFENGSTLLRQGVGDDLVPFYFESPVIRLVTECGYSDVYHNGREPQNAEDLAGLKDPGRALWVYRYYEQASEVFGDGKRDEVETLALGLHDMVERLRGLYTAYGKSVGADYGNTFKVFLVAHSMGGLVVRSYLQKVLPDKQGKRFNVANLPVDKVFTYGTPHNGIELQGLGNRINVGLYDINNFYRPNMARYLGFARNHGNKPVNSLNGKFPAERLFALIGTNEADYDVPLSAAAVGAMSDGLVRIKNAYTSGSPRAHVHRAHGGPVGLVNSEDGYQNLHRFLFGDTRIDGKLEINGLTLPRKIEQAQQEKKSVNANLYFETVLSVRGGRGWNLTRRKFSENSAVRRQLGSFYTRQNKFRSNSVALFSAFLRKHLLINKRMKYMAFAIELGVFTDRIEVDRKWWLDEHFDGISFLRQKLFIEIAPPGNDGSWKLKFAIDSPESSYTQVEAQPVSADQCRFVIPITNSKRPGIEAQLILDASSWS